MRGDFRSNPLIGESENLIPCGLTPCPARLTRVVNPVGGTRPGLSVLTEIQPIFAASTVQLTVHVTERSGYATELARAGDFDHCDGLCVIGGDGTLHEMINGLVKRDDPDRTRSFCMSLGAFFDCPIVICCVYWTSWNPRPG